mgnify:CR=1 FL=1
MTVQIIRTNDGSDTYYCPHANEHYHSVHGAITESLHVFITNGLLQCTKRSVSVLEVGFGTGLNALLTCIQALKQQIQINYTAIEKNPLCSDELSALNYGKLLGPEAGIWFSAIHECRWNITAPIHAGFILHKQTGDINNMTLSGMYDVVYYDAFSPGAQPEMWTGHIFSNLFNHMLPGAVFTTYSAKGAVRRLLQSAGFTVHRLSGPAGKREMLNAIKP